MGILMGGASGASILGWCFQLRHSYNAGFVLMECVLVISCIIFARLGRYRFEPRGRRATETVAASVSR